MTGSTPSIRTGGRSARSGPIGESTVRQRVAVHQLRMIDEFRHRVAARARDVGALQAIEDLGRRQLARRRRQ